MLGYLDALIAALAVRDSDEAERLLAHPLAQLLPDEVRAEAAGFAAGDRDPLAAPLSTMLLRHRTAELLRDAPALADQPEERDQPSVPPTLVPRRAARHTQMELPLSA